MNIFLFVDIHRTFPNNLYFCSDTDSQSLRKPLYNVLMAVGHKNSSKGYCQVSIFEIIGDYSDILRMIICIYSNGFENNTPFRVVETHTLFEFQTKGKPPFRILLCFRFFFVKQNSFRKKSIPLFVPDTLF